MKLHASGEDYLETILVLKKKLGMVRSVDVARHMEVSKPSVCHTDRKSTRLNSSHTDSSRMPSSA